jgi:hypothetical protein
MTNISILKSKTITNKFGHKITIIKIAKASIPMEYGIKVTKVVDTQKTAQNKLSFPFFILYFTLDDFKASLIFGNYL